MSQPSLTSASRFYQRWLNAAPQRAEQAAQLADTPLDGLDLAATLAKLANAVTPPLPLERAMRQLRNLLVCGLIARDLDGKADLNEVVTAMTGFADFAIQAHVAAIMAEMVAQHGMPVGEESGQQQELMVLAMGKQGGGELNVSSDIDLIFVYPEDGDTQATLPGQRSLSIASIIQLISECICFLLTMMAMNNNSISLLMSCTNDRSANTLSTARNKHDRSRCRHRLNVFKCSSHSYILIRT